MTTNVITAPYNDAFSVSFTSEAWLNATAVAKHYGKLPGEWLRLDSTIEYIDCLCEFQLRDNPAFDKNQLTMIKKGSSVNGGGTWFHPKLIVPFARWLDVRFSIWCDMQIEKILHPALPLIATPSLPLKKTQKAISGGLSLETQDEIKKMIIDRAELLPKDKQGGAIRAMWGALSGHFETKALKGDSKLAAYKFIPEGSRLECLSLIARLPIDDGVVTIPLVEYEQLKALPSPTKEGDFLPKTDPTKELTELAQRVAMLEAGAMLNSLPPDVAEFQATKLLADKFHIIPKTGFRPRSFVKDYLTEDQLLTTLDAVSSRIQAIGLAKRGKLAA